jgi:hypothetical protein
MKARLYYFNKKTRKQDERAFDKLYRDLHCVTRANDHSKVLADNALTVLTNLVSMLLVKENKTICVNQDFLSDITGKEVDQNTNLLKQLKDIISCKYHRMVRFEGKRYNYCYIIEFSEDGEKRASNPELFYTIDSKINLVRRGKKFGLIAEKIQPSYIDKTREIKKEIEEEAKAYSSSISKKEKINKKKKANSQSAEIVQISNIKLDVKPQEQIIEVPTLAISSLAELAKVYQTEEIRSEARKVVNCDQLEEQPYEKIVQLKSRILVEEAASISSEEGSVNTGKIDQITQLKAEIFKAFDSKTSEEIMENCTFTELEPNKLGISIKAKFSFSEHDKQMLKTCVHMTYGSEIKMVNTSATAKPTPIEEVRKVMQAQSNCLKWDRFKNELLKYFPEKTGDHILNAWFDKIRVSEDAPNNRIILTGSRFYVDSVYNRFQSAIEHVVTKNKVTLELHFENNDEKPIIYKPNGGGR